MRSATWQRETEMVWIIGGLLLLAIAAVAHIIVDDWKHKHDWKPPL